MSSIKDGYIQTCCTQQSKVKVKDRCSSVVCGCLFQQAMVVERIYRMHERERGAEPKQCSIV